MAVETYRNPLQQLTTATDRERRKVVEVTHSFSIVLDSVAVTSLSSGGPRKDNGPVAVAFVNLN